MMRQVYRRNLNEFESDVDDPCHYQGEWVAVWGSPVAVSGAVVDPLILRAIRSEGASHGQVDYYYDVFYLLPVLTKEIIATGPYAPVFFCFTYP